jgi:hypothetical protein
MLHHEMIMKIMTKTSRILGLVLAAWTCVFVLVPRAADAEDPCTTGSFVGSCKSACASDELPGESIVLASPKLTLPTCAGGLTCCFKRGDNLCSVASGESGAAGAAKMRFVCSPAGSCETTRLADKVPLGEACSDGSECCATTEKGPEDTAPSTGGAGSSIDLSKYDPLGGASFQGVIKNVISAFLGMVGAFALLVFVYAGITWMTAGSSERVQKAKDAMKYAVIGLAIIAFSYVISSFMINALTGGIKATPTTPEPAFENAPTLGD